MSRKAKLGPKVESCFLKTPALLASKTIVKGNVSFTKFIKKERIADFHFCDTLFYQLHGRGRSISMSSTIFW